MPGDATNFPSPQGFDATPPRGVPESISRAELRSLVREWTTRLKEQGLPPERVLAIVKSRVREVILPRATHYAESDVAEPRQDRLMSDSSQWCIEAMYEPSDQ